MTSSGLQMSKQVVNLVTEIGRLTNSGWIFEKLVDGRLVNPDLSI
jgi:hypothetical protein